MSNFIQLHTLTSYGPSNLNRDDQGRPKSVSLGGANRLRLSSQCLKRAWRTSDVFAGFVGEHLGIRTRRIGDEVIAHLTAKQVAEKKAKEIAKTISGLWSASGNGKDTLALFSQREFANVLDVADRLASGALKEITMDDLMLREDTAIDAALWGRMIAAAPEHNIEAACQVSHAVTTHRCDAEDDWFAAVDDRDPNGAGHIAARQFGAGIYYTYVCINRDLLLTNLNGNTALADAAIEACVRAATKVSPGGMQASFASRSPASYVLAEIGTEQPRSLVSAFTKPVRGMNQLESASR